MVGLGRLEDRHRVRKPVLEGSERVVDDVTARSAEVIGGLDPERDQAIEEVAVHRMQCPFQKQHRGEGRVGRVIEVTWQPVANRQHEGCPGQARSQIEGIVGSPANFVLVESAPDRVGRVTLGPGQCQDDRGVMGSWYRVSDAGDDANTASKRSGCLAA